MPPTRKPLRLLAAALRTRCTREHAAVAIAGLGLAVLLGLLDRALAPEAGAAGITSAALGAIIALTIYRSIGRK